MKDLSADLKADLLADLATPVVEEHVVAEEPALLLPELTHATPALSLQWTPLRWSRPKVVRAQGGTGKALRLGPLSVEIAVKD